MNPHDILNRKGDRARYVSQDNAQPFAHVAEHYADRCRRPSRSGYVPSGRHLRALERRCAVAWSVSMNA